MKLPISVFIIAKNEADRINKPILSVIDWVDEVIVIDSGSTDGTQELAKTLGAKVIYNEWQGYGQQKIFGEKQCRNKWLLNIDADEEISPELAEEIQEIFCPPLEGGRTHNVSQGGMGNDLDLPPPNLSLPNSAPPHLLSRSLLAKAKGGGNITVGYRLKIMALYPSQEKLPRFAAGTSQVRLYHKDFGGFKDSTVHDSVVLKGAEKMLKGKVIHRSHRSHSHTIEKINFYTSMQAEDLYNKGKNPSAIKIILTPFQAFIKCYFFKNYVFYGLDGFIHSSIYAFGRTLRLAKAREKFRK
jgi:glycosyltransferase involved in cell wall biosynthesis